MSNGERTKRNKKWEWAWQTCFIIYFLGCVFYVYVNASINRMAVQCMRFYVWLIKAQRWMLNTLLPSFLCAEQRNSSTKIVRTFIFTSIHVPHVDVWGCYNEWKRKRIFRNNSSQMLKHSDSGGEEDQTDKKLCKLFHQDKWLCMHAIYLVTSNIIILLIFVSCVRF